MAFCATCGAQVEGRFCAKCGSPVAAGGPAMGAPPPPPLGPPGAAQAGLSENAASALCYVFLLGILFLILAPYNQNRNIKFHAFQSIFLCVGAFVLSIGLSITMSLMGVFTMFSVMMLVRLLLFILWLYVIISTYQGKTIVLPIIGQLAQQQAQS